MTLSPPVEMLGAQTPQIVHLPPDVHSHAAATEAIELAASLGMTLDESQRFTLTAALGERKDGTHAAFEVGDIEPRQNGKGDTIQAREAWGLILAGERLQIHTAHEFPTANEAFLRMVQLVESNRDFEKLVQRIRFANGEQGIELKSGQRLKYRARTGGAGRGFAGADLVVLDEAYAVMPEHLAAIMPTLSTAPDPQLWLGSSAGLSHSRVLWGMRKRALSGAGGRLAWCEHSAEDVTIDAAGRVVSTPIDPADRRLWAIANPALGTRISWDYVESEFAAMPPEQFARERLGVFDPIPDEVNREPKLPLPEWVASARDGVTPPAGRISLAFDVDLDARHASVAVAAGTPGAPYVEVVEHRDGVGWLAGRLVELVQHHGPLAVGYNGAGPALQAVGAIVHAFHEAGISTDLLTPCGQADYRAACGAFLSHVAAGSLTRPTGQQPLDLAGEDATERPLGEGWVWHRRQATVPISPLVSATVAVWLLPTEAEKPKPVFAF